MPAEVVVGAPAPVEVEAPGVAAAEATEAGPMPPNLGDEAPSGQEVQVPPANLAPAVERSFQSGDFLTVVGSVNVTEGTAEIVDVRRVDQALVPSGEPGDTLVLRALDGSGAEIGQWNVPFLPNSEREPGEDLMGVLDAVVPFPDNVKTIEVLVEGEVADSFTAPEPGPAPSAELDLRRAEGAPGGIAGPVILDWSSVGSVPEGTTFDVQASADGEAWNTVAIGLTETRAEFDLSSFEPAPTELRLLMRDGFSERVLDTVEMSAPD
jgi:hypothetical protein